MKLVSSNAMQWEQDVNYLILEMAEMRMFRARRE